MADFIIADDIDDADDDHDGGLLADDYSFLDAGGEVWDLNNPDDVNQLVEYLGKLRQKLKSDDLEEYEDTSTDWGVGGRARLRYDQERAELAQDYHAGKTDLDFSSQHRAAMDKVRTIAIANRHRWA